MTTKILFIAIGGAFGSVLRYAIAGWVQRGSGAQFPAGTMAVNVVGCFTIGLLGAMFAGPLLVREPYRLAVLIGVLGGFTTFSAFAWETISLANDRQFARALLNVLLTNAACLVAAWGGYRLGERWFGV